MMRRVSKMLGALLGAATGSGVAWLLSLAGVDVPPPVASAIATVLGAVGAWVAPANAEPPPWEEPQRQQ